MIQIKEKYFLLFLFIQLVFLGLFGYTVINNPTHVMTSHSQQSSTEQNKIFVTLLSEMQLLNKQLKQEPRKIELSNTLSHIIKQELGIYLTETSMQQSQAQLTNDEENLPTENQTYTSVDSIEHEQHLEDASNIVYDAISNEVWNENDTLAIMEFTPFLSSAERSELVEVLGNAINSQQLAIDGPILF